MDQILTTVEAAKLAGVSHSTIYKWIRDGRLNPINRNVTRGAGCGYKIHQSELDRCVYGWTEIETPSKPDPKKMGTLIKVEELQLDRESMRIAAANLRIAIEFAQEELTKIEKLL